MKFKISTTIKIDEYNKIQEIVDSGRYRSVAQFCNVAIVRLLSREYDMLHLTSKDFRKIREAFGIQ